MTVETPKLTINYNKLLGVLATVLAGVIAHYAPDGLREVINMGITGSVAAISVAAHTRDTAGDKLNKETKSNESQ